MRAIGSFSILAVKCAMRRRARMIAAARHASSTPSASTRRMSRKESARGLDSRVATGFPGKERRQRKNLRNAPLLSAYGMRGRRSQFGYTTRAVQHIGAELILITAREKPLVCANLCPRQQTALRRRLFHADGNERLGGERGG